MFSLIQATPPVNTGNPLVRTYSSPTQPGSFLVCIVAASVVNSSPTVTPTIDLPSTPGLTWQLLATENFNFGTYASEIVAVFGCPNAPALADTVQTSVTGVLGSGSQSFGMQLLELGGGLNAVDVTAGASGNAPTPASAGDLVTSAADFILCFVTDPFYNTEFVAGAGYTGIPTGLGAGYGYGQYMVTTGAGTYPTAYNSAISGGWCMVAVALMSSSPVLEVSPTSLSFTALAGGPNPPSQFVTIENGDGGTLDWNVSSNSSWLSAAPDSGSGDSSLDVSVDIAGLTGGIYTGHLTVTSDSGSNSPQVVTGILSLISCVPSTSDGIFVADLGLYIGPATALFNTPVPAADIAVNEDTSQGRNAIILDFNDSEGLYARDLECVFAWPLGTPLVLDIYQPSIIPLDDDVYERLSYHFLMSSLAGVGWQHLRELNLAYSSNTPLNLLLTFDQWPDINITLPATGGTEIKTKFNMPSNKWKLCEGFLSSAEPFLLWRSDCEFTVGQWGRSDSYRVTKPFAG